MSEATYILCYKDLLILEEVCIWFIDLISNVYHSEWEKKKFL